MAERHILVPIPVQPPNSIRARPMNTDFYRTLDRRIIHRRKIAIDRGMQISGGVLISRTSLSSIDANWHAFGQDKEVDLRVPRKKLPDRPGNLTLVIRQRNRLMRSARSRIRAMNGNRLGYPTLSGIVFRNRRGNWTVSVIYEQYFVGYVADSRCRQRSSVALRGNNESEGRNDHKPEQGNRTNQGKKPPPRHLSRMCSIQIIEITPLRAFAKRRPSPSAYTRPAKPGRAGPGAEASS